MTELIYMIFPDRLYHYKKKVI